MSGDASFVVQFGQIALSTDDEFLVLQQTGGSGTPFDTIYFQENRNTGSELLVNGHELGEVAALPRGIVLE